MQIAYLITSLTVGGAEKQLVDVSLELQRRGHMVNVTSMVTPAAFMSELQDVGISVHSLHMGRGRASVSGFRRWVGHLRALEPDIVHSHLVHANLLARAARPLYRRASYVTTAHTVRQGGRILRALDRATLSLSDVATGVSEAVIQTYGDRAGRAVVVPNGVWVPGEAAKEERIVARGVLGLPASHFVWLAVGRLVPAKGYPYLLDAWKALEQRTSQPVVLLVCGEGPMEEELREQARRLRLKSVALLGVRHDVDVLMRAADAYVLPSVWEGLPLTVLEAMANNLPAVLTDVGGVGEPVRGTPLEHLLVPARDPCQLAETMAEVTAMPESARAALGREAGQAVARAYGLKSIVDRWERLYDNLLHSTR